MYRKLTQIYQANGYEVLNIRKSYSHKGVQIFITILRDKYGGIYTSTACVITERGEYNIKWLYLWLLQSAEQVAIEWRTHNDNQ